MKNIVIAAGYATRLYPLTENCPKPLLKIGMNTILGRLLDDIDKIPEITEHIIVSNHKFVHHFEDWKNEKRYTKPVTIIDDGTSTNETRLGAVRDLLLALDKCQVDEDILVIAADNILDFSFKGFIEEFHKKETSMIMCHYQAELEKLQRTGVIAVDDNMKVLEMQEKPEFPVSNWAVPPFYIYKKSDLALIKDCMNHGCGFDAPGNLAHYLVDRTEVHAWIMAGTRFDIGSMDTYKQAQEIYR
jgi:glucose-1-phosphate thymidylyltransferase